MRKLIGVGLILVSIGLFFLLSMVGLAPYLRYAIITFGIGAGIFMMVADGIISAFQGQDLAGLDQYLSEEEPQSGEAPSMPDETGGSENAMDSEISTVQTNHASIEE